MYILLREMPSVLLLYMGLILCLLKGRFMMRFTTLSGDGTIHIKRVIEGETMKKSQCQ